MSAVSVIVAGARTPIGRYLGGLASISAVELGAIAIRGALERSGLGPGDVDHVVMGHVIQAGAGQAPARQAAALAGIGASVAATTLNTVCLSGIDAVMQADRLIRLGEADVVVAGGMESMSLAPHLVRNARAGVGFGDASLVDSLQFDGLWDIATQQAMGALTDAANAAGSAFTREQQDAFAARSHARAATAQASRVLAEEIVPVEVVSRKSTTVIDADEGIRADTTVESLSRLRPAFSPTGTVTAGSASQLSDGAAALVIMRKELAIARGLEWLVEIGPYAQVAGPDSTLQLQPANAITAALSRDGLSVADLDLVEINEAFAAVGLASMDALGLDEGKVNVLGGAIALGHPLGMSGARVVLSLAYALRRAGGGLAVAALCGGSGQGSALVVRR